MFELEYDFRFRTTTEVLTTPKDNITAWILDRSALLNPLKTSPEYTRTGIYGTCML